MDFLIFSQRTSANNIELNEIKEFTVSFLKKQPSLPPLTVNNQPLGAVPATKLLVYPNYIGPQVEHVEYICSKVSKRLYALRIL